MEFTLPKLTMFMVASITNIYLILFIDKANASYPSI